VIYDPLTPLAALPDSVIVTIVLRTLNPAETITVPVGFSTNSPPFSFGNTDGQSVVGTVVNGSVTIQSGCPGCATRYYLPMVWHWPGSGEPPPPPTDCYNPIQNGDFEATSWWQFPATEYTAGYSTARSHSPIRSARTGIVSGWNTYSYSSVRSPSIYIPADAYRVKLHIWEYPSSSEVGYGAQLALDLLPAKPELGKPFGLAPLAYDVQYAIILDPYDNVLEFVMWKLSSEHDWVWHQFGLLRYAGQSIKVQFGTYNDGWGGISSMYVDDVDMEICR
jgi:hypothetical protein